MRSWPTKKLGEVCEINPRNGRIQNPNLEVGFLTMADVSEDAQILNIQKKKLSGVRSGFSTFINGDVLVAKITPCFENGKGAFVENMPNGIGFGSTEFHVLRANKDFLSGKYLYYIVSNERFRKSYAKFMTGSAGQQRISTDFLKKIKIPLPPLKIQKQIVERMDKIAEAQKLNDELIQKADELFQSLLHQELNPIGKNWGIRKLAENAFITSGGTPSRKRLEFFGGAIPWVKSGELKDGFVWDTEEKITEEALDKSSAKIFPIDTVLIAMYGATVGKVGMLKISATTNQAIAGIQPKKDILDPYFIFYFFLLIAPMLIGKSVGGAQPNINQGIIKNLKIPTPPLKTQHQIVEKLSAAQEYKKKLLRQKELLQELFDSTLDKAMKGEEVK